MAKSKNRRKNGKVKQYKKPEVKTIKVEDLPKPICKHCGEKTRLASPAEMAHFRSIDSSFNQPFLFLPTCDCWEKHDDWMEWETE